MTRPPSAKASSTKTSAAKTSAENSATASAAANPPMPAASTASKSTAGKSPTGTPAAAGPASGTSGEPGADGAVTIWHNPECSTSRNVLAAIRAKGITPEIVLYLKTPPSRAALAAAVKAAGLTAGQAVRRKGGLFDELALADAGDGALLDAMAAHPALIERPFVFTAKGVRLCRPLERLQEILP